MGFQALTISTLVFAGALYADSPSSLGKSLFFDPRLSSNGAISCASCHEPARAFTNGKAVATGVHGAVGDRNVPTLINRKGTHKQFWDMRADSLTTQAKMVISDRNEMGGDLFGAVIRLNQDKKLSERFKNVFREPPTVENLAMALAAYVSTLQSGEAPYDRYVHGDSGALTQEQIRGKDLFFNKFRCASCHSGDNFTDERLNVRCYPLTANLPPLPSSSQKFKTPTLRNLIYTAPYMHNGALATLAEAVEFYNPSQHLNAGGKPEPGQPAIHINAAEKRALVAFLRSLSSNTPYVEQ